MGDGGRSKKVASGRPQDTGFSTTETTTDERTACPRCVRLHPVRYALGERAPATPVPLSGITVKQFVRKPLRNGWLYLRDKAGRWREYEIKGGELHACIWSSADYGEDVRPSGARVPAIEVRPDDVIEVAYSEIQWTWKTYERMYGSAELRAARMQRFECARIAQRQPMDHTLMDVDVAADVEFPGRVGPQADQTHVEPNAAIVCIHDALGIAYDLNDHFQNLLVGRNERIARDAHRKLISDIADKVLAHQPAFGDHIKAGEKAAFVVEYAAALHLFDLKIVVTLQELVRWLERKDAHSAHQELQDADLAVQAAELEQMWASCIEGLGSQKESLEFLRRQIDNETSWTRLTVDLAIPATAATDTLAEALAIPLAEMRPRFVWVKTILARRYSVDIVEESLLLHQFIETIYQRHGGHWVPVLQPVYKRIPRLTTVDVVEFTEMQKLFRLPPLAEARIIRINGVNVNELATKVHTMPRLGRLIGVLQFVNLYNSVGDFSKHGGIEAVRVTGAILSTIGAVGTVLEETAALGSRKVGRFVVTEVAKKVAMRAGVAAGFLDVIYNAYKAHGELQSGDTGAAASYTVAAVGSAAGAVGGVILLAVAGNTAAVGGANFWNPIGWGLLIGGAVIAIAGIISLCWTDNSPMEDWLLHCYWGKEKYKDYTTTEAKAVNAAAWAKDPTKELQVFHEIIYQVKIEPEWDRDLFSKDTFTVEIEIASYDDAKSLVLCEVRSSSLGGERTHYKALQSDERLEGGGRKFTLTWRPQDFPSGVEMVQLTVWYAPDRYGPLLIPDEDGQRVQVGRTWW